VISLDPVEKNVVYVEIGKTFYEIILSAYTGLGGLYVQLGLIVAFITT
jgi:hypothetical protein